MFFSKWKQETRQVAETVENTFRPHFIDALISSHHIFQPPAKFYFDGYILGFTVTLISLFRDHLLKKGGLAPEKKAQFVLDVFGNLSVNEEVKQKLKTYFVENWPTLQHEAEYVRGTDDAIKLFGVIYGLISEGNDDPAIRLAYEEADNYVRGGLAQNRAQGAMIALQARTIGAHIKRLYGAAAPV